MLLTLAVHIIKQENDLKYTRYYLLIDVAPVMLYATDEGSYWKKKKFHCHHCEHLRFQWLSKLPGELSSSCTP